MLAEHLIMIDTLDRENLGVEMHQRATTRTAVITDHSTGHEYEIEGKRILFHHLNDSLDALVADDESDAEHESAVVAD